MAYNSAKTCPEYGEIIESRVNFDDGAGLFNLNFQQPNVAEVFNTEFWSECQAVHGGRGSAWFVKDSNQDYVLRHFRRGGAMASVLDNKYLFRSQDSTRSFAEFRLLAYMWQQGLPVPQPIAAGYRRSGMFYTAQLLTQRLSNTATWSQQLTSQSVDQVQWAQVGQLVARFHALNIDHADLNVDNILLDDSGQMYLIDFDKGLIRSAQQVPWLQRNLRRLRRSVIKQLAQGEATEGFEDGWNQLISAYEHAIQN